MPSFLQQIDLDDEVRRLDPSSYYIINDLPNRTEEDRDFFNWLIKETLTDDILSMRPRCRCGELQAEHLKGETCDVCGTVVSSVIQDNIRPMLWFRAPQGVDALISPNVWIMLQKRFSKKGCSVIQWLCDRSYIPQTKPPILQKLQKQGFDRGLNYFIRNFDEIFAFLIKAPDFATKRHTNRYMKEMVGIDVKMDALEYFVHHHREIIFPKYLPLLNRIMLVEERTGNERFVEGNLLTIQNALNTMLSIDRDHYDRSSAAVESRTAKILAMLSAHYENYIATNLRPKPGIYRKNVYGTRCNHTMRCVVTSNQEISDYDELYLPWSASIATFWQHIMNILLRRDHPLGGMTHIQATAYLIDHVEKYDERLDLIFQELIRESRYGAIIVMMQRNPSLPQGSAEALRATKIKTNPADKTVSSNELIATSMNLDYDGDETNFMIALDHVMEDLFMPFRPHFNLLLLDEPFKISRNASMSDSVVASTSEWLSKQRKELLKKRA